MHIAFRLFYLNNKTCATLRDGHIAGIFSSLYTWAERVWVENMPDNLVRVIMGDRTSVIPNTSAVNKMSIHSVSCWPKDFQSFLKNFNLSLENFWYVCMLTWSTRVWLTRGMERNPPVFLDFNCKMRSCVCLQNIPTVGLWSIIRAPLIEMSMHALMNCICMKCLCVSRNVCNKTTVGGALSFIQ